MKRVLYIKKYESVRVYFEDGKSFTQHYSKTVPTYEEALRFAETIPKELVLHWEDGWYTLEDLLTEVGAEEIFSRNFLKKNERDYL